MYNFFKSSRAKQTIKYSPFVSKRSLSTSINPLKVNNNSKACGAFVKIQPIPEDERLGKLAEIYEDIIFKHSNCLFIATMPTKRILNGIENNIEPGHNFSFLTDHAGNIKSSLSKRPDLSKKRERRVCAPDHRFTGSRHQILFEPVFPTVKQEIQHWITHSKYPLIFHILPCDQGLNINAKDIEDNIEFIKQLKAPYSLFDYMHENGHYIAANNCNLVTEQAIFGLQSRTLQAVSCQEAAVDIVSRIFRKSFGDYHEYLQVIDEAGILEGVEKNLTDPENYQPLFTA